MSWRGSDPWLSAQGTVENHIPLQNPVGYVGVQWSSLNCPGAQIIELDSSALEPLSPDPLSV